MNENSQNSNFIDKLSKLTVDNDPIDPALYEKFNVKRGLRYADGRGVLVGLTKIGDVVGYYIDEAGNKVAIPGKLIYRGYNVEDIVKDAELHHQFGFEQCVYLLLFGQLPTQSQLDEFSSFLGSLRSLPEYFTEDMIMKAPSSDIMNKIARGVLASYSPAFQHWLLMAIRQNAVITTEKACTFIIRFQNLALRKISCVLQEMTKATLALKLKFLTLRLFFMPSTVEETTLLLQFT